MVLVVGYGTPLASEIVSASPAELTLIELLDSRILRRKPKRLIYDRADDAIPCGPASHDVESN